MSCALADRDALLDEADSLDLLADLTSDEDETEAKVRRLRAKAKALRVKAGAP